MSFQIPMGELIKELTSIQNEAKEWDPDGNIEWDITVFVISMKSGYVWSHKKKYFLKKQDAIAQRNHINKRFPKDKPAKVLQVTVKLNRKENEDVEKTKQAE